MASPEHRIDSEIVFDFSKVVGIYSKRDGYFVVADMRPGFGFNIGGFVAGEVFNNRMLLDLYNQLLLYGKPLPQLEYKLIEEGLERINKSRQPLDVTDYFHVFPCEYSLEWYVYSGAMEQLNERAEHGEDVEVLKLEFKRHMFAGAKDALSMVPVWQAS